MKSLFTFLLVGLTISGFSQNPNSFIDQDANWNVARSFIDNNPDNPSFVSTTTTVFGFSGDSLIDNELWDKYYITSDSNFVNGLTYVGSMQEADGIVLFRDTLSELNTLYNFNLQVGDSVFYEFDFEGVYIKISTVDSIEINGVAHRRLFFEEPPFPPFELNEVWIQGIGSIHGPLFPLNPSLFSSELPGSVDLICYKENDQVVWSNPDFNDCYINIVLSVVEIKGSAFNIYPNPAQNKVFISSDNGIKIKEVNIYNQLGQNVLHQTSYDGSIDVSSLMPGVYFVEVAVDEKSNNEKLVIK